MMMTIWYIILALLIVINIYLLMRRKKSGKFKNKFELYVSIYGIVALSTFFLLGISNLGETHYLLHQVLMILFVFVPGVILGYKYCSMKNNSKLGSILKLFFFIYMIAILPAIFLFSGVLNLDETLHQVLTFLVMLILGVIALGYIVFFQKKNK